jgi:hypothetical protein
MIRKKTVFVLGAGAHKSYGLPLGSELLESILDLLRKFQNPGYPWEWQKFCV